MNIVVNEELKAYIDPLTPDEYAALERSILTEGCRDALVLWGDVLVDGHNRYGICQKHGIPFQTVQNTRFRNIEDVHLWMIDQHLGRRSVSDYLRGVLALRKKEIVEARKAQELEAASSAEHDPNDPPFDVDPADAALPPQAPLNSREAIARAARLSSSQVVMIEKIQKLAAPELVAAIKSGAISLNAAAAVSSLPAEEQAAAANGGKDELRQAAKRVRDANASKRKPREAREPVAEAEADAPAHEELDALRQRVAELTKENDALRKQVANLLGQLR